MDEPEPAFSLLVLFVYFLYSQPCVRVCDLNYVGGVLALPPGSFEFKRRRS